MADDKDNTAKDQNAAAVAHAGLDTQGQFRIGDRYTLGVRGTKLCIMEAGSGREKTISEADLQGLLRDTYFAD